MTLRCTSESLTTHYVLTPDVAGELGDGTELDRCVHPPRVQRLEYVIDNWLGDDLVEAYPAFLVSEALFGPLRSAWLGGYELRDAEITFEGEARETLSMIGRTEFPEFRWLHVTGTAGQDDFGRATAGNLVVSGHALNVLQQGRLTRCDIEEYDAAVHK